MTCPNDSLSNSFDDALGDSLGDSLGNTLLQPATILAYPQMGENIGASARVMLNFGLTRLRLIAPRDGWPNPQASAMASGAGRVLDAAQLYKTSADAFADCTHIYATTARKRFLGKPILSPRDAVAKAHALAREGARIGFIFGPERAGLENHEIARANAIINIPVNTAFQSLNLAQAVGIIAYEWWLISNDTPPLTGSFAQEAPKKAALAESGEIERLYTAFETQLSARNFFWPAEKADGMRLKLRNMFTRFDMTKADIKTFYKILRTLEQKAYPKKAADAPKL